MQPWKKISLTEDQLQVIYREWGVFYTHKQKLDIAAKYYDISLDLKTDPKALYHRSRCKRSIAKTDGALVDATAALASDSLSQPYNLELCDAHYELNAFETTRCELYNNSQKFQGLKLDAFKQRNDLLSENFNATVDDTLGQFILENGRYFFKALQKLEQDLDVDQRPLWKILREQEKCDVISVLEKEEVLLSPREIARRKRSFTVFNQMYMRRSWIDVLFLKALQSNPNLLLPQSKWSRPQLEYLTQNKYDVVMRFLKMLHARSPLYTEKVRRCPNKNLAEKKRADYLFRVQYQIHRNMLTILQRIRHLRLTKQIEKLSTYVEEVMGDYVVLKTRRVMPWKFQFLNEVYNLLGLAYIDQYVDIPKNIKYYKQEDRLRELLKLPTEKDKEPLSFVFGKKATHQDADAADIPLMKYKKYVTRLEKRIIFAKNPIEKSYLYHEIARSHLKNGRFDDCCVVARKSIDEAKSCNSNVWALLGLLVTCKSHAVLRKVEKINEVLREALVATRGLKNRDIVKFITFLHQTNEHDAQYKRTQEDLRKNKSRHSVSSFAKGSD